jgi:tRNA (guanine37-N1)-methyltransferase
MMGGGVKTEQWAVRVPRTDAETTRQKLILEGRLDVRLKPWSDGNFVTFPVTSGGEGDPKEVFEVHPVRDEALPRHDLIGSIAILQEPDIAAAEVLLAGRKGITTVLAPVSPVQGEYRVRSLQILAGDPTTETVVHEYGYRFRIDLGKAYFSQRLATERQRVASLAGKEETVLDMFAGVGPFAITLADRVRFVVAVDINPWAVILLLENCAMNHADNILPVLADSRKISRILPWVYDRVIMNLPLNAIDFVGDAFRLCRPGGTIHLYCLASEERQFHDRIREYPVESMAEHVVRSYSPGKWHVVYDIVVGKKRD